MIDPQRLQRAYQSTREEAGEPPAEKKAKGAKPTPAGYTYAILLRCGSAAAQLSRRGLVAWAYQAHRVRIGRLTFRDGTFGPPIRRHPKSRTGRRVWNQRLRSHIEHRETPVACRAADTRRVERTGLDAPARENRRQSRFGSLFTSHDDWRTQGDWIGRWPGDFELPVCGDYIATSIRLLRLAPGYCPGSSSSTK